MLSTASALLTATEEAVIAQEQMELARLRLPQLR